MNVASRAGLALAACVMSAGPAWGQGMVPYFNDSRTEPYMERTGGSRIAFSSTDDGSGQVMLPFSFRFYGQTHNRVWVSTNGFITFSSASATSLGNTNFPSSGNPNGVIAGLWDDLLGPTGTYHLEGTSPSRVMIIQIKNITGFGGSRNGTANFQYRLYEGMSGRFEIHYGPMTTSGTGWTASIGYENQAGNRGHAFQSCTSSCNSAQINMLANRVFRAQQDAGMDVFAAGIEAPERVFAGVPFDVMTTLVSQHMNNVGPFNYAVHLLGPGQTGPVNSVWTSGTVTLTPYQTRMATDSISIPLSTPRGRYRLALQADPGNMLMEPDESNNFVIGMRDIEVAERQPDYTISRVAVSNTSVRPGDIVDVNVDLANAGNLTGGTEWQIVLSTNQVISRDDRVVHTSSTTLAPLTTVTTTTSITLPSDLAPGSYYVGAIIDPAQNTLELDEINNTGASMMQLVVGSPTVTIETNLLPGGYPGVPYQVFLQARGGDGSYSWSAMGDLPPGLMLTPQTGEIKGTATMAGTYDFTVTVMSSGLMASAPLSIVIAEQGGVLSIVTRELLPGLVGQAYPPREPGSDPSNLQRVIALGGSGTLMFSLASSPPPGLSMAPDGLLSGVPQQRGVYSLDVVVTDGTMTSSRTIPLTVGEAGRLTLIASDLPDGTVEEDYNFRLQVIGRAVTSSITFTLVEGTELPPGISLTQAGGLVGLPQRVGRSEFAVRVEEMPSGSRDTANFTLNVNSDAGFGIVPSTLPPATLNVPYEAELAARGGTPPFAWRVVPTTDLPRGMRFEVVTRAGRETVQFEGTPEEIPTSGGESTGGISTVLVSVRDAVGRQARISISLQIVAPKEEPPPPPPTNTGCAASDGAGSDSWVLAIVLVGLFVRRRRRAVR